MSGRDFRRDPLPPSADDGTWVFFEGIWTQYVPRSKQAWVRATEDLPGMFPLDPREFGATEAREGLVKQLSRSRIVEANTASKTTGIELLLEFTDGRRKGHRYRCVFDPDKNMLPINVEYLMPDGKVNVIINIAYQKVGDQIGWVPIPGMAGSAQAWFPSIGIVISRQAWFPVMCVRSFPLGSGQTLVTRVEDIRIGKRVAPDAFEVKLPAGTRVSDSVRHDFYRVD